MKAVIRADASARLGSGHVMRCFCLADALRARGVESEFASCDLPAGLRALVTAHGHAVHDLPATGEQADALATLAAVPGASLAIVDHYALGIGWESTVRKHLPLLAIDDLGRRHECDWLLDQNLHAEAEARYADRVPRGARLLLGPRHALLREEFARARLGQSPRAGDVRRVLVSLGGADAAGHTLPVLRAIGEVAAYRGGVDVVIGDGHPQHEAIAAWCEARGNAALHVQTRDMAGLLLGCDLAIGAGGSSTWERCALGVPAIALCVADNQRELLQQASRAGLLIAPDVAPGDVAALARQFEAALANPGLLAHLSQRARDAVDALGAARVAAVLAGTRVGVRPAVMGDAQRVHAWRNAPAVRSVSRDPRPIPLDSHREWFERTLASGRHCLLVGEHEGQPFGVVRYDLDGAAAELSIFLAPEAAGRGRGPALLAAAEDWLKRERPAVALLQAHVQAGNAPSRRLFEGAGYTLQSLRYEKRIA